MVAPRAVRVRGPFRGPSGYERHTRSFVRELARQGVAVELVELPDWGPARLPAGALDPWFETLGRPVDAAVALQLCMPHQVVPMGGLPTVNHTMFEADRIPPAWVAHAHEADLIAVPTPSSFDAWTASGVAAEKVRLAPLGVDAAAFTAAAEPLEVVLADGRRLRDLPVRFLNVSELGPRKNLDGLLRAWLRATTRDDPAALVLKIGAYAPGWREELERRVAEVERAVGKPFAEAAPVHRIYDVLADADVPRLYAAATHYLSLSHGEGWDQCMVEAGAAGLRLIAPDHSAYRAYLDPSTATLIPARPAPAFFPGGGHVGRLFDGLSWWEPDEEAAVAALRRAIEGRDPPATPRDRIVAEMTWERATARLIEVLAEAAARGRPPPRWPLPRASTAA